MKEFLIISVVASVLLTIIVNLLPMLFPNAAAKAERKIVDKMQQTHSERMDPNSSRVRAFFLWKIMLIGSIVLTVLVNVFGFAAR